MDNRNTTESRAPRRGRRRALIVLALLAGGLALRLAGLGRAPFWLDEVCTVWLSEPGVAQLAKANARDVHPPLYYLGLHYWRKVLGDSEAPIRAYSVLWSVLGLWAIFLLARDIGGWAAGLVALLLAAVNPLHVYYAQEARNYAQVVTLATFASWCLWRWMAAASASGAPHRAAGWAVAYALFAAATLYTHHIGIMVLLAQGMFALLWFAVQRRWRSYAGYLAAALAVALLFLPWFLYVLHFRATFYNPLLRWMKTPEPCDYYAFLGHEFFLGSVWDWDASPWPPAMILAVGTIALALREALRRKRDLAPDVARPSRAGILYALWLLAVPVLLAFLTVQFYDQVYFRVRFALFVLPPFLVLAGVACASLPRRNATALAAGLLAGVMLFGVLTQQSRPTKPNWQEFAEVWRTQGPPGAVVFFPVGIEVVMSYYLKQPLLPVSRRQLEELLPGLEGRDLWVGLISGQSVSPSDFEYYQWLLTRGPVRRLPGVDSISVQVVTVREEESRKSALDGWFAPFDIPKRIQGFRNAKEFSILELDRDTSVSFRWSAPKARFTLFEAAAFTTVVLNVQLPPVPTADYRPALKFFIARGEDEADLFSAAPTLSINDYRIGPFEVELSVPPGEEPLQLGWTINAVNPAYSGMGRDRRDLGLRIHWVGVKKRRD